MRATLTRTSLLTYAVTYFRRFPYTFGFSFIGVILLLGRDGFHISFQGSRGGNDTRLHCLGTVEISGLCFVLFCFSRLHLGFVSLGFFSCTSVLSGGWVIRDTHYFLATGCGWLGLVASETMGCGVVFCLKSISWGSFLVGES